MPLKWLANENPVVSSKLNKMCVTFWANQAAIDTAQVQVGSLVYLEDVKKLKIVDQVTPSLVLKSVGGGGMIAKLYFGVFYQVDPADRVGYGSNLGLAFESVTETAHPGSTISWTESISDAAGTFNDSQTYNAPSVLSFGGKNIGKVIIRVALSARAQWSVFDNHSIKLNATNTKIEILDGVTVKATWALPDDVSTDINNTDVRSISHEVIAVFDLGGIAFTDFRVRVTIDSTVNIITSLTRHRHDYFGKFSGQGSISIDFATLGICEVELQS